MQQKIEELSIEQKKVIKLFLESNSLDLNDFISKNNYDITFDKIHIKDLNDIAKFKIQPTKDQHYVQKAYLDLFKNTNNQQWEIDILDMKLKKVVKMIMCRRLFLLNWNLKTRYYVSNYRMVFMKIWE